MVVHDARPNSFNQIATTADWEKLLTTAGVWDGIDGNTSMTPSFNGRNIEITPGTVIIKGQIWWCDAVVDTAIPTADVTYDRYDVLVLRLDRSFPSSLASVAPYIITGQPASAPVVPVIQQTTSGLYDIPVAQWKSHHSPAGTPGAVDTLVDRRQFSGHSVVAMLSTSRPSPAHPRLGLEYDTGYLQRWDGSTWRNIGPKNQVLQTGNMITGGGYAPMHASFAIPANDSILGPVSYRLRAGGHGVQAAGTPRSFALEIAAFGQSWAEIQNTGGISAGSNFDWHYSCELIVSANGQASFYGDFSCSHSVPNPAPSTANQAMSRQLNAGGIPAATLAAATTMFLQGKWMSTSGAPTMSCYGATFDRVAN